MRCPDCARQKTQTRTLQSMAVEPIATYVLIAINVAIFVGAQQQRCRPTSELVLLYGPLGAPRASGGGWSRPGFLHTEIWHIAAEHARAVLARADDRAGARPRALRRRSTSSSLLCGSLGVMILAPDDADARRLGRGLRPARRGDRDGPQPQHQPDPVGPGADPGAQPRAHVLLAGHLARRAPRRADRRPGRDVRGRGARARAGATRWCRPSSPASCSAWPRRPRRSRCDRVRRARAALHAARAAPGRGRGAARGRATPGPSTSRGPGRENHAAASATTICSAPSAGQLVARRRAPPRRPRSTS